MRLDAVDAFAVAGCGAVVLASRTLAGPIVAALLAGVLLTAATWRLYGGRVWEALGWTAWVGAASLLAVGIGDAPSAVAFFVALLVGLGLVFGGRFDLLPDVWIVAGSAER